MSPGTEPSIRHDQVFSSVPDIVRQRARQHPERIAIHDDLDTGAVTYGELHQRMLAAIRAMMNLGVRPGDRVALCGPNSARWIEAALGIQGAGGVLVPVNTRFRGSEIGHLLTTSRARAFVTVGSLLGFEYVPSLRDAVPGASALDRIVTLDDAQVEGAITFSDAVAIGESKVPLGEAAARIDGITVDQLSDIMFTSGTTGAPKGVQLSHGQSLRAFGFYGDVLGIGADDCLMVIPPFFHAFGYKAGWLLALMFGASLVPQRIFDPADVLQRIEHFRVTSMSGPPTLFSDLMSHADLARRDVTSLSTALVSSARVPVELIHEMRRTLGIDAVFSGYGLTEATAIVTLTRRSDPPETVATTAGTPIAGIEVKIAAADGTEAAPGEPGEVLVRGWNVTHGYWEDPTATKEAIDNDGWLHTGDIGQMSKDGYLSITDRKKDMFIVGGFNAYPAEIEAALCTLEGVSNAAVVGVPDARLGEVGVAFVATHDPELTEADVYAHARRVLANFKVPRRVVLVDDLPRNASMKVVKETLRAQAIELDARSASEIAADTSS